ncbi:hypothetical protein [Streptomyces smyrnaeus]|uniref:phage tail tube protein n=1 Tax=Streptomyces smyrnaeus TaxID=1387713 RepID=UPI0033FB9EE6
MAVNADNVRVGLNGNVYVAPKGTAAPTDLTTAWGAAWKDLGYLNDDGVEMEYSTDVEDIMAWQSLSPVRRVLTSVDMTLAFTAIELRADAMTLYFPDSTITEVTAGTVYKLDIPSAPGSAEMAFGFEWVDDTIINRVIIPRGEVTDRESVNFQRGEPVGLGMTVSAYASSSPELATWLSNDPSWATA